jgi:hypothetical protein
MLSTWNTVTAALRRTGAAFIVTAIVLLASAATAAAQQAPAQAAPAPQARVLTGDVGLMFNIIKPDKTADFEMVMGKLKEAFAKTEDPVFKQMGKSFRVLKNPEPIQGGNYLYAFLIDPPVKDADYTVSKVLAAVFPAEVQELFKVYAACFAGGVTLQNYVIVADMR